MLSAASTVSKTRRFLLQVLGAARKKTERLFEGYQLEVTTKPLGDHASGEPRLAEKQIIGHEDGAADENDAYKVCTT